MDGWQPIETAPRGTCLLTWHCGSVCIGWKGTDTGAWIDWRHDEFLTVPPTHWMPLPSAPKGEL